MESRQNLIRLARNIASSRGHKMEEFQLIPRRTSGIIDPNKISPEKKAEMERNREAGRILGRIKATKLEGDINDYLLEPPKALEAVPFATCKCCKAFAVAFPTPAGIALDIDCPGKPMPGLTVPPED